LRRLYSHRPNIVSKENLISAVWPVRETGNTSYDEQNLRKLVSRLRERLEPGVAGRESRFVRSARGRGYWLSVE
jgi:DNA-binding winged helix-turn-helix (wHTH) protein